MAGPIQAAGVVLLREGKAGLETLLVHRPRHDDWSLPKGKLDSGESWPAAAARECEEETAIRPRLGVPLGVQTYKVEGRPKEVRYWAATVAEQSRFRPNKEVDEVRWVPVKDVRKWTTYRRDVRFVRKAAALPECEPLILLRHTTSVKRGSFKGPDAKRPLSKAGIAEAKQLVASLQAYDPEKVYSSDWVRCTETVRPLAAARKQRVVSLPALNEDAHEKNPKAAMRRTRAIAERPVSAVICGHRPVLPDMMHAIQSLAGVDKALVQEPLAMGEYVILHRGRNKGTWRVIATERYSLG